MNLIYLKSSFITRMVYLDPVPSWLVSSISRALHRYRRGHGFKSRTDFNFFRVLFSTTRFSSVLCREDLLISSLTSSQIYEFHISKIIIRLKMFHHLLHAVKRTVSSLLMLMVAHNTICLFFFWVLYNSISKLDRLVQSFHWKYFLVMSTFSIKFAGPLGIASQCLVNGMIDSHI